MVRALRWNAERLRAMGSHEGSEAWLRALVQSHTLRGVDDGGDSPVARMERLYQLAGSLEPLERQVKRGQARLTLRFALPRWAILWVPGLWAVAFGLALFRRNFEDRLLTFAGVWVVFGVLAVGVVGWNLAVEGRARQQRRAEARGAHARRTEVWAALGRTVSELAEGPFVVRSGDRLVVHCPELDRLLAHTEAHPEDPAAQAALEALRQTLDGYLEHPPEVWADAGLKG